MQNIELEISKMENTNNTINDSDIENKGELLSKNRDAEEILSTDSDDISIIITKHLEKKQKELFEINNENKNLFNKSHISYFDDETKKRIKNKLAKSIERDINEMIHWKYNYIRIGNCFESISQILTLGSTVVAFTAGYMDEKYLSFIAGCLGSISLAILKASVYSYKESKERNQQLNKILETFEFKEIPDFIKEH